MNDNIYYVLKNPITDDYGVYPVSGESFVVYKNKEAIDAFCKANKEKGFSYVGVKIIEVEE